MTSGRGYVWWVYTYRFFTQRVILFKLGSENLSIRVEGH